MSEVVVVSSGGLDDILMESLMIRKLPRAEVRDRQAKPHQSKLDFRVRELKRETRLLAFPTKALPCSSLGHARQAYIEKPHKDLSCTS